MDVSEDHASTETAAPDVAQIDVQALAEIQLPSLPRGDTFFVALSVTARRDMDAHARSRMDVEVGGVLLGRPMRIGERPVLTIDAIIPAMAAESRDTNITFTAETWTQIHASIDRDHPGAAIVGWYHTHPAFGIFLSEMDVFIQRNFFDLPHQVAIVIDPVANDEGVFVWHDGVPVRDALHDPDAPAIAKVPSITRSMIRAEPFAAAMAYARDEDALPADEFMLALRRRLGERAIPLRRRVGFIGRHSGMLADAIGRFDRGQKLALAALITLVIAIFACLLYVIERGDSPGSGVEPMKIKVPAVAGIVRE